MKKTLFTILTSIVILLVVFQGTARAVYVPASTSSGNSDSTSDTCSTTNVTTDSCYDQYCTGQSSTDSTACRDYAVSWTVSNNPENLQCSSISTSNQSTCCPDGESDSPMCYAYDVHGGSSVSPSASSSSGTCSATNVNSALCYEQQCTGQSSEDSASCNAYAQMVVNRDDGGDTTCMSISEGNEQQCCSGQGNGDTNESPMCVAYDNYSNQDATNESMACSTIGNDATYENCCTGQSSEDSAACQQYATQDAIALGEPQCASIGTANETQCCPDGASDSAMCYAYDNYTDGDAAAESTSVPQQLGGGAPSTNPVNGTAASAITSSGAAASASQAAAVCSAIKFDNLLDIMAWVKCVIGGIIIPGIFTLAFATFLWGVFKFIRASEEKDKQESKQFIYMGLIGLFVMVSVWGIINIATKTFGFSSVVPTLQTGSPSSTGSTSTSTTSPTSSSTGSN